MTPRVKSITNSRGIRGTTGRDAGEAGRHQCKGRGRRGPEAWTEQSSRPDAAATEQATGPGARSQGCGRTCEYRGKRRG